MSSDIDNPAIVAYRMTILEGKVDKLHEKFDLFQAQVTGRMCPNPGACIQLLDGVTRMEKLQESHASRLLESEKKQSDLQRQFEEKSNFARGAIWVASGLGAVLGLLGPVLITGIKSLLFAAPGIPKP